jgi:hypothetical protein
VPLSHSAPLTVLFRVSERSRLACAATCWVFALHRIHKCSEAFFGHICGMVEQWAEGAPLAAFPLLSLTSRNTGSPAFSRANDGCECGTFVLDESPPDSIFQRAQDDSDSQISDAPILNVRPRPAARCARAVHKFFRPKRAQGTPGARCTRSPLCKVESTGVEATWGRKTSARLDASVGASGPHDFAVRGQHLSSTCLRSITGS